MKKDRFRNMQLNKKKEFAFNLSYSVFFTMVLGLISLSAFSQVASAVDSTSVKIGAQITYQIDVEVDTPSLVVFPEGQTFLPLEMLESYSIDTLKKKDKFRLIKKYGLTQFDSGSYTIPRQKVIIGDRTFFTDSLKVKVNNVVVDTTQGLYDIKPIIAVNKQGSNWWQYVLLALLIIGVIAFLLFWLFLRKKPLTEEEEIALLPPYDRAKIALKKLDESAFLEHENLKDYYSELTFIIRKYLDEKVYDKALESTTDELITRLNLLKEGSQIDLTNKDIKSLESILKRADLVKFAKSAPDVELAKIDRGTIDVEIDHVKEALPEPTEEEKLQDEKYRIEQEEKKKRKKRWIIVGASLMLLLTILTGFSIKYGFNYVKDTIIGHHTKTLLENDWVESQYGFPPITIETPKVLKRTTPELQEAEAKQISLTQFSYGSLAEGFKVEIATTNIKNLEENKIDLQQVIDTNLKFLENKGAQNIITKSETFKTPNGAEGLKVFGNMDSPILGTDKLEKGKYVILGFSAKSVVQQILLFYKEDDVYADKIVTRILNSVELKPAKE